MFDLIVIVYSSHTSNMEHAIYVFKNRQTKSSLDAGAGSPPLPAGFVLAVLLLPEPMLASSGIRRVKL